MALGFRVFPQGAKSFIRSLRKANKMGGCAIYKHSAATRLTSPVVASLFVICVSISLHAQTPSPSATPAVVINSSAPDVNALTLDEALRLANAQASTYQSA